VVNVITPEKLNKTILFAKPTILTTRWHRRYVKSLWCLISSPGKLLNHVIPISPEHLNRLLKEYRVFYNTARPHQANEGESPIPIDQVANDVLYANGRLKVDATPWLGGLHRSYRKVA
jgi:hypothetical protein